MPNIIMITNTDTDKIPIKSCSPEDVLRAKIIAATKMRFAECNCSLFHAFEVTLESGFSSIITYAKLRGVVVNDTYLSYKLKMFDFLTDNDYKLDEYYVMQLNWYFTNPDLSIFDKSIIEKLKPNIEQYKEKINDMEERTAKLRHELSKTIITHRSDLEAFLEYWNTVYSTNGMQLYLNIYRLGIIEGRNQPK